MVRVLAEHPASRPTTPSSHRLVRAGPNCLPSPTAHQAAKVNPAAHAQARAQAQGPRRRPVGPYEKAWHAPPAPKEGTSCGWPGQATLPTRQTAQGVTAAAIIITSSIDLHSHSPRPSLAAPACICPEPASQHTSCAGAGTAAARMGSCAAHATAAGPSCAGSRPHNLQPYNQTTPHHTHHVPHHTPPWSTSSSSSLKSLSHSRI